MSMPTNLITAPCTPHVGKPEDQTMRNMSETQRAGVAQVYRGKSAKQRARLRKTTPLAVFGSFALHVDGQPPRPGDWGFSLALTDRHPYGGWLELALQGKRCRTEFTFVPGGDGLIPSCEIDYIENVSKLLGFDPEHRPEGNNMWHFEITDRAEHDEQFAKLAGLLQESIADVHLLRDGSYCRVYQLRGETVVEYRGREDQHVTVSGLQTFLKLKGVEMNHG